MIGLLLLVVSNNLYLRLMWNATYFLSLIKISKFFISYLLFPWPQHSLTNKLYDLITEWLIVVLIYIWLGAERLVRHLHDSKVPICLATSSSVESVEVKTTHHQELFELFHHKVMGSSDKDVKDGKPAPDIFLVAARRFPDSPKPIDVRYNKISFNVLNSNF